MDPVFLAGTKSGNVGRATLDNSNVDCVDDDDDGCCLSYAGRDEGCDYSDTMRVMLFNKRIIALSHCCYLPRSAKLATEASASIRFLEISQRL